MPTPIRVQAENFTIESGFSVRDRSVADGGQLIRLGRNANGQASLDLDSAGVVAGLNDISITFFDENDGVSTLEVLIRGGRKFPG